MSRTTFYLSELNIQVQNGHGVLSRQAQYPKCMELACRVLHDHFGSVYLFNIDEKRCFLK